MEVKIPDASRLHDTSNNSAKTENERMVNSLERYFTDILIREAREGKYNATLHCLDYSIRFPMKGITNSDVGDAFNNFLDKLVAKGYTVYRHPVICSNVYCADVKW